MTTPTTTALRRPTSTIRFAIAFTAASALAGGGYVAQVHADPSHNLVLSRPTPARKPAPAVTATSYAITGASSVRLQGYSRTSSATPLA